MQDEIVTDLNELSKPPEHDPGVDHWEVAGQLKSVLDEVGGLGLSANQIGIQNSRTCLVRVLQDIFLINPRIANRQRTTRTEEGCLSIPGERVQTRRSIWVEVEADAWFVEEVGVWNEIGKSLSFGPDTWTDQMESNKSLKQNRGDYLESIAVQHEVSHLRGETIYDFEVQNQPFEKSELQKLGRNDKVYVRNEEGEEFDVKWKYAKKYESWTVLRINEK